ncbi:MAG: hypothetical protein CVU56_12410 [Deltaproteobacteria bacterium HGW-Deltaproteobacteria-14]|jgi:hypothetical protein|nr:MAG: hypothetical protein CVU56_12410 [Deltaproteobacteria bacterium HGW-Deltaproteobacteria-14]
MLRSHARTLIALALGSLLVGSTAVAAGGPGPAQVARLDVRALVSAELPDGLWRAAVIDDDGIPALVVEQVRASGLATASGLPTQQRRIDGFRFGPGFLTFAGQAEALEGLAFGRRALRFDVVTGAERLICEVPLRGSDAFQARCAAEADVSDTAFGPGRTSWASRPEVIAACEDAFFGASNEAACLDRVARFPYPPAGIVAACDAQTFGDANALACLALAAAAVADPSRTLAACDAAMYGDTNTLACFRLALRARWDATPAIAACDRAMYGDDNALRCIGTAVRAPIDVSRTVDACDQASYGDDAALTCLSRSASL